MSGTPTSLTLRTYQVGFGDCFLLTFHYAGDARHVLIDFGSTAFPRAGAHRKPPLLRIAEDIRAECGGKLHAVIVTHRHRDHLAGFEPRKDGKGPGDLIRALEPEVVVQPWTEDPALAVDALGPREVPSPAQAFARSLHDMQDVAAAVLREARRMRGVPKGVAQQLEFLGEDNLRNAAAVKNLATLGKRQVYAHYGSSTGLEKVLPGVRVRVLGPPTLQQWGAIRASRAHDESEYWHLQATSEPASAARGRPKPLFKNAVDLRSRAAPPEARWFIPRVRDLRAESLLELVRVLDGALNNTSLILLFEAGGRKLLFPGDAQLENWSWALQHAPDAAEVRALLADVNVLKVGHHGSLNATPKSLWSLFKNKGPARAPGRLATVMSTLPGKHGRDERGTEVPRSSLVKELERSSNLFSTQTIKGRKLREDIRIVFPT